MPDEKTCAYCGDNAHGWCVGCHKDVCSECKRPGYELCDMCHELKYEEEKEVTGWWWKKT